MIYHLSSLGLLGTDRLWTGHQAQRRLNNLLLSECHGTARCATRCPTDEIFYTSYYLNMADERHAILLEFLGSFLADVSRYGVWDRVQGVGNATKWSNVFLTLQFITCIQYFSLRFIVIYISLNLIHSRNIFNTVVMHQTPASNMATTTDYLLGNSYRAPRRQDELGWKLIHKLEVDISSLSSSLNCFPIS